MSTKNSPKSPITKSPFKFLRGFSKKQRKSLKIAVLGGPEVGKSAFVVRYLTRRYIGDYCSKLENTYPHNSVVDNALIPLLVWDTSISSGQNMSGKLNTVISWCDVILLLYSVTDLQSYNLACEINANIQNYYFNYDLEDRSSIPVIMVGNKNDLWHQRQIVTDLACQEAQEKGFANFFEISVKESLDQVRIVFEDGIRRGLAVRRHRRGHSRRIYQSLSNDLDLSEHSKETSPESEEGTSPKTAVNIPTILLTIKKKLTSPKSSEVLKPSPVPPPTNSTSPREQNYVGVRSRSYTYSGKFKLNGRERKLSVFEPSDCHN